jgi:hypothetical protein
MSRDAEGAIRRIAAARRLPAAHVERWLAMDAEGRAAFVSIAETLRLRTGQLVRALEWLDETAVREKTTVGAVLERDSIRRAVGSRGSAPERARAFLGALERLRRPRLGRALERLRAEIASLRLPQAVKVHLPKDLATDSFTVELTIRSAEDLGQALAVLARERERLAALARLLGGEDAI